MTARIGQPKTGGRKRGSVDREQRKVLTDKMAADLMWCYAKLGGRAWLLEFAKDQPGEFLRQGLSRLFPPPQRDDIPDVLVQQQFNSGLTDFEAARRVAFCLAKAAYEQKALEPVPKITPQEACRVPHPDTPPLLQPEVVEDPERTKWASELHLSDEERRDRRLIEQTQNATLATYSGSSAEQALAAVKKSLL
ncbi:hypothetical protein [Pseudomonas sp. R5(2019)]|uniref:hypothetical protein n=1 Tax=Pseudomonas sp. R5(2019) TaxID=2697566 RepID=UPI001411FEE4|nr:hypothetical protein [Pseudomonas sp. R5(2019)]NBA96304.1 hypothetical protein [Pseudomonas sp. R5(2019)]